MDEEEQDRIPTITGDGDVVGDGNDVNVTKFDQHGQTVTAQTIIRGSVYGPVLSGTFNAPVTLQGGDKPCSYEPPPFPDPDTLPDPGGLPPCSRIPFARNALFTGREESLKALARALNLGSSLRGRGGQGVLVTQAIEGMGGIGKTQLAVEFAYRYGRFFGGVHWINAAQPDAIGAEIAACGAALALPNWPDKQPEQIACTLAAWQQGYPRLVILDNLEEVAAAREWLPRLCSAACVLLTARRTDWPRDLGLHPLHLATFTPEESRAFLGSALPSLAGRRTWDEVDALAERLGHLPLALELAARYLATRPRLPIPAYLEQLSRVLDHPAMQAFRADLGSPTGHDLSLAATFALSWEQVQDADARQLFLFAGYCAPNTPIPCELLEQAADLDTEACDAALSLLTGLGLMEMDDPAAGPSLHPLLSEYARTLAQQVPNDAGESSDEGELRLTDHVSRLSSALARLARSANDRMNETGSLTHFLPLLPHVRHVAPTAEEAAPEDAASLWGNLGYYLHRIADFSGARAAYERALRIDEAVYGPDHPNVARDVNNLGMVLEDLGDLFGARVALERALRIDEATYGPDHPNVATIVNNLGGVLQDLGDLAGARTAFERALHIWEKSLGPEHPQVAIGVNNLGSVLRDLGDLSGARAAFDRALRIDEAVYGPGHINVARDVNNLGGVLRALGDLPGAWAAFERAFYINKAVYGPNHPNIASHVNNLGMVLKDLGYLADAREAFEWALHIDEAFYGPDHPEVATDVNNLGGVLRGLGDLPGARAAFERAMRIDEATYSPDHPNVACDLNNLGLVLRDLGGLSGARAAFDRALRIDEAVYGLDHPCVAIDLNNLGGVLYDLGDLSGARVALERALRILQNSQLPPDHPYIRSSRDSLAALDKQER